MSEPYIDITKHRGKFYISHDLLKLNSPSVYEIMSKCIIFRAESLFLDGMIAYVACSKYFDPIEPQEATPTYEWVYVNGAWTATKTNEVIL